MNNIAFETIETIQMEHDLLRHKLYMAFDLLVKHFNGDLEKFALWLNTKNTLLGNISPKEMAALGNPDKIIKFIEDCLAGNLP
jgi:uroporphyrinogen-III decarboxylase